MIDKTIVCFHNPDEINGYLSNWNEINELMKREFMSEWDKFIGGSLNYEKN